MAAPNPRGHSSAQFSTCIPSGLPNEKVREARRLLQWYKSRTSRSVHDETPLFLAAKVFFRVNSKKQ